MEGRRREGGEGVWWQYASGFLSAIAAVLGSVWAIRAVIKHEQQACDTRLQAYKNGLADAEHEDR